VVVPTHARDDVREAIVFLQPEAGTAIGDGLAQAVALVKRSLAADVRAGGTKKPHGAIVLLSDGTQTNGLREPQEGAALARRAGIPVDTIALGTDGPRAVLPGPGNVLIPVHPDPELMRAIAAETNGKTFTARTADQLSSVFGDLSSSLGRERRSREITSWFLLAAGVVLVAAVALGRLLAGSVSS
jgi:Ca-activated chloride channel family protein